MRQDIYSSISAESMLLKIYVQYWSGKNFTKTGHEGLEGEQR
jgi:hypothetical protein